MKKSVRKKAVVTGGTRGIGLSIANALFDGGYEVLITGTHEKEQSYPKFLYETCDFSSLPMIEKLADRLKTYAPDILINNAGVNVISPFEDIALETFMKIQQINIIAPFRFCQAVIGNMKAKQWGRIVNIASIWSKISKSGRASYSTSKFGLDGMTAALSAELSQHNILVNCVSPGFIETDLTKNTLGDEGMKKICYDIPIKRLGQTQEIAELVLWLISDKNTYLSGQNIAIDGGFTRV